MKIRTKEALMDYVNQGNPVKYLCFWGHQAPPSGVSKSCFSQWYHSPFKVNGALYPTAEHYMMAEKARLFGDEEAALKALAAKNPGEAKKIGRQVKGFDNEIWLQQRFEIVAEGSYHKFKQHPAFGDFLLATHQRILVEASPVDKIWGIGLAQDHADCENPNRWKGLNLLGFALMEARDRLKAEKMA